MSDIPTPQDRLDWTILDNAKKAIRIADLEKQLAERDAALARCVGDRKSILTPAVCGVSGHFRFQENGGNCLMCQREKRLIDEAVAASAQATAKVQQWRPIETAPRNSSPVLVANKNSCGEWRVRSAWWRLPYEGAPMDRCSWCYGSANEILLDKSVHGIGATHWMPLPEPPTEAIREEKETK